jgi:hypothetical protein
VGFVSIFGAQEEGRVGERKDLLNFPLDQILILKSRRFTSRNKEESMIPSRVVPHIFFDQLLCSFQFSLVPEVESTHQPLSIAPDVVVFRVEFKHL